MSKDESPAAFPLGANEYGGHGSQAGMTLRDYFAAKAMQAAITGAEGVGLLREDQRKAAWLKVAQLSYEIADAMLAARDA
ncbi:hypothetical protein I5H11_19345 [Pseudomonas aeruginosa]|nr:hypothetical protein [Pseudomonas aeruginosa]